MRLISIVALSSLLLLAAGTAMAADGKALYAKDCARCHGADGKADTPVAKAMKVPALGSQSGDEVVAVVRENDKHKAVSAKLSDAELAAIAQVVAAF